MTFVLYFLKSNFLYLFFASYLINFLIFLIFKTLHLYFYVDHIIALIVLYALYFSYFFNCFLCIYMDDVLSEINFNNNITMKLSYHTDGSYKGVLLKTVHTYQHEWGVVNCCHSGQSIDSSVSIQFD